MQWIIFNYNFNMINLNLYLTTFNLFYFILCIVPLIYICIKYQNLKFTKLTPLAIKKDFQQYIDKYYITNFYYTWFSALSYILIHIFIFIIFRYYLLGSSNALIKLKGTFDIIYICFFILHIILFIIAFVLFHFFITLLFFREVKKLHIYFTNQLSDVWFYFYKNKVTFQNIIGPLYLFMDNIAQLNLELTDEFYDEHYEYRKIYSVQIIKSLHTKGVNFCKKRLFIHMIFKLLNKPLRLIFVHAGFSFLNFSFCYLVLFVSVFFDIMYNQSFYYTYYSLFFTSLVKLIYKCYNYFIYNNTSFTRILYKYFYGNKSPYNIQRLYFNTKSDLVFTSDENNALFKELLEQQFRVYILNNLTMVYEDPKNIETKIIWMYIRFTFLTIALFLALYFIRHYNDYILLIDNKSIPHLILIIPTIMMYFTHIYTFKKSPEQEVEGYYYYNYNRRCGLLFWLITALQMYLYWIVIFKSTVMDLPDDLLFNVCNLKIFIKLTMESKDIFFDTYYKYYADLFGFSNVYKDMLDIYVLNNDYKKTYCNIFTVHDMKVHIEILVSNYHLYLVDYLKTLQEQQQVHHMNVLTYFSIVLSIYTITFHVVPSIMLSYLLYKPYEQFAQDLLLKTFIIDMDPLAFKDLTTNFIAWLNKEESSYAILIKVIEYLCS